ncbi:hypothetical protein RIEGSTA812A_PEG_1177 [invertebrate metagenome]|uniref:Uncharacterized protein n=1 Tax=invertebrate metagenome TaxID=1711999 RepID=A0A484H7I8_9ZZZZ
MAVVRVLGYDDECRGCSNLAHWLLHGRAEWRVYQIAGGGYA